MRLKWVVSIIIIFICGEVNSQNVNHFGLFPVIDHSGQLSDKWNYSFYYFGAFNLINEKVNGVAEGPNFAVFYSEQAITYQLNTHLSFTGSYVYERQLPLDKDNYRNENRFYLQTTLNSNIGRALMRYRLRYDGRFIQNRVTGESPYTSRLRFLIGATVSLSQKNNRLYFTAYNEMFFNTYKNPVTVYAENWAFAGIGLRTKKSGAFELGPFYIAFVDYTGGNLLNYYYLQFNWITHLDSRKEKN